MNCPKDSSWYRNLNRFIALGIFIVTLSLYSMTAQSSVAYWDCAEYAATSPTLQVPHPPGAPLFSLVTRISSVIPVVGDIAMRMNLVSALASALAIMFLYLIGVRVISRWKGFPVDMRSGIVMFGSAGIGALTLSVSDTFWFNAVESGLFATSIFFISIILWLALVWFDESEKPGGERYLLLAAYLLGLSSGVHQLCLLSYFPIAVLIYFRNYEFEWKRMIRFAAAAILGFFVIYPGIVKWFVAMLSGDWGIGPLKFSGSVFVQMIPVAAVLLAVYGINRAVKKKERLLGTILTAGVLVLIGYSTYTLIYVRANADPPVNENDPATMQNLVSYLERLQYGKQPVFWPRRWNPDPRSQANYAKYSSDFNYYWSYQLSHMYLRYLGFNFIGRAGDVQDAPVAFLTGANSWHDGERGYPVRYFAIPFILALFGLWYHFKKDWKFALAFLTMFIVMGLALTVYFNMADPQPRERDYFFVGSFFVFAMWVGIGASGIIELLADRVKQAKWKTWLALVIVVIVLVLSPVNMFRENLYSHDRHDNYAPLDISYDILQSCKPNAILFTGGDNDTFPLWYLQESMGVRTDVRVICLSLANTDWYLLQLKNETPHGAGKVPFNFTDRQIKEIADGGALRWEPKTLKLPVPPDVYREFGIADTSAKGYIEYTLEPTLGGDVRGIRVQDLMVNSIVTANAWRRPISFAITVSPQDCIGLQKYFVRQGLVYNLTPESGDGPYFDRINVPVMRECLFNEVDSCSRSPLYGFMYKDLDKRGIHYDSNTRNMIYTLRDSFVTLASYFQAHNENHECASTLDMMESKMPAEAISINYKLMSYVARLYFLAGAQPQFHRFTGIAEKGALEAIADNPSDFQTSYNPYSVLLGLYDMGKEYDKSIALLEKVRGLVPNDPSIGRTIKELRALQEAKAKRRQGDSAR